LTLVVSVTVDDFFIARNENDINWFMDGLENIFKITRDGEISKYLGVSYEWGPDTNGKDYCKTMMNKKLKAIVEAYEKYIDKNVNAYDTPETPGLYLDKHEGDPVIINKYRSFVGKITFFTTKLSPKTGSATRTLSGHMSSPDPLHWKLMDRLIGYLKGINLKGLLYIEP